MLSVFFTGLAGRVWTKVGQPATWFGWIAVGQDLRVRPLACWQRADTRAEGVTPGRLPERALASRVLWQLSGKGWNEERSGLHERSA